MAITKNLNQIEREFLYKQLGALAKPAMGLNQLRRMFFESELSSTEASEGLNSLERRWLQQTITTNGGTPNSTYISDLWVQLLATTTITPTLRLNTNKKLYWIANS